MTQTTLSRHTGGVISPRTILAAVNFSDASHAALVLAARLAGRCGAQPHVLFVEDPLLDAAAGRSGIDLAAASRAELRRLIWHEWPAPECSPQLHVVAGSEVDVVLDVARQQGADLIVIGDRPISRLERLVFGSTTERLLRLSDVSVLVAPAGWTPRTARPRMQSRTVARSTTSSKPGSKSSAARPDSTLAESPIARCRPRPCQS